MTYDDYQGEVMLAIWRRVGELNPLELMDLGRHLNISAKTLENFKQARIKELQES